MAGKISEVQSMPFHQLIGAPLLALIQGQAQAAQATAEFIERVGLQSKEGSAAEQIRMLSFGYQKPDAEGNMRSFRVEIPLLSLVPIPAIQIKESELDFYVKVNDFKILKSATSLSSEKANGEDWLAQEQAEFRTSIASGPGSGATSNTSMLMRVTMRVEQAAIPPGVTELFRRFEQSIRSIEDTPSPQVEETEEPSEEASPSPQE